MIKNFVEGASATPDPNPVREPEGQRFPLTATVTAMTTTTSALGQP
jgi:hypothetical protein